MDQKLFEEALAAAQQQPATPNAAGPAPEEAAGPSAPTPSAAPVGPEAAYGGPAQADPNADPEAWQAEATARAKTAGTEPGLIDTGSAQEAVLGGAANAVFQTKDFIFGAPEKEDRNGIRAAVEDGTEQLGQHSMFDRVAAGLSQFAVGMVGVGKLAKAGQVLPWFGSAVNAAKGVRGGAATLEAVKAAAVGAVAFDPMDDRFSNMIEGTALANPITRFLKAEPTDSRAMGRMKNAMESLGMDAGLVGTFTVGAQAWKLMRLGKTAEAAKLTDKLERDLAKMDAPSEELPPVTPEDAANAETLPEIDVNAAEPSPTGEPVGASPEGVPGGAEVPPQALPEDVQTRGPEAIPDAGAPEGVAGPVEPAPEVPTVPAEGVTTQVDNVTQAAAQEGITPQGAPKTGFKKPSMVDFDVDKVLDGLRGDLKAVEEHGGVWGALDADHKFATGDGIPWQKLSAPEEVDMLTARMAEAMEARIAKGRGGTDGILSDKEVTQGVMQRAALWGEDPKMALGLLQQAGKAARGLAAQMEAGFMITEKLRLEAFKLAQRIQFGDIKEFSGNANAAKMQFKALLSLAGDAYTNTMAIRAAGGRVVRRNRAEFKMDPNLLKDVDIDVAMDLMLKTGGDSRKIARLQKPGVLQAASDYARYVLINNLVSGPKTQIINILSNGAMMGIRPVEKLIGSSGQMLYAKATGDAALLGSANRQNREARKMAGYYMASIADAFSQAKTAFIRNDSVLKPHSTELFQANMAQSGPIQWKSPDDIVGLLHNALYTAHVAIGMPTRGLGFVDELVKQTVYRAKLAATAHADAIESGMGQGLRGKKLEDYVKQAVSEKLDKGFDEFGRGTDTDALREAQIATFSQDLQSGLGKTVQAAAQNNIALGYLLPFIKTPTNVLKYGQKLSPGLNLFQKEFRDSLLGRSGANLQAEAIGQFSLGTLAAGYAATAAIEGHITGGGPTDPKAKKELMATGWQPYSKVYTNADGSKKYVPYGRMDPVAIPLGMAADIVDMMHAAGGADKFDAGSAITSLVMALSKQFRDKSYLLNLSQAMEAVFDNDPEGEKAQRFMGNLTSNFVPFSAAMRQFNPDDTLREARDVVDRIKATVPGLSDSLPARYDAWGDPITAYARNWVSSDDKGGNVDREMQRLFTEVGTAPTPVSPRPQGGVDLRDITMKNGKNAYAEYQTLAGHLPNNAKPLKEIISKVISSAAYKKAPDGTADTKGTKTWILVDQMRAYRSAAFKLLQRDPVVREALLKDQRDVYAAYKNGGKPVAKPSAIEQLGQSFGVDLSSFTGGGQ